MGAERAVRVTGRLLPLRAHKHAVGQETSEQAPPRPGSTEPSSSPSRASPGRGGGAEGGKDEGCGRGRAARPTRPGTGLPHRRPGGAPGEPPRRPAAGPGRCQGGGQGERLHGRGARCLCQVAGGTYPPQDPRSSLTQGILLPREAAATRCPERQL